MLSTVLYAVAGLCVAAAIVLWWADPERPQRSGAVPGPGSARVATPAPPSRSTPPPPGSAPLPAAPRLHPTVTGTPHVPPPLSPRVVVDPRVAEERRRLIELCIDLGDRLSDENAALASRLYRGLADVGVELVEPDGSVFDRRQHDALDAQPAPTPEQVRTVAGTARVGFTDRGEVLRRPGVVVYTSEERRDD